MAYWWEEIEERVLRRPSIKAFLKKITTELRTIVSALKILPYLQWSRKFVVVNLSWGLRKLRSRVTAILGTAVLIGLILPRWFEVSGDALSTFYIAAGAMVGGMLAIVFTLSIFALQISAPEDGAVDLRVVRQNGKPRTADHSDDTVRVRDFNGNEVLDLIKAPSFGTIDLKEE